jgi:hypothetical protein
MKTESYYYVETTYDEEGNDLTQFRAHVTRAHTPREAEEDAIASTRRKHPGATNVEFFLTRRITDEKAESIMRSFANGTWTGRPWPLSA